MLLVVCRGYDHQGVGLHVRTTGYASSCASLFEAKRRRRCASLTWLRKIKALTPIRPAQSSSNRVADVLLVRRSRILVRVERGGALSRASKLLYL